MGVNIVSQDLMHETPYYLPKADVYTTFDSMEHWHDSPKNLFNAVSNSISECEGGFVLGVPNCVNLRNRLTISFDRGKWSTMDTWYEHDIYRGHVREPDTGDLDYIAKDMSPTDYDIVGANWVAHKNPQKAIRLITKVIDKPMRLLPSICGDIYLVGTKSK